MVKTDFLHLKPIKVTNVGLGIDDKYSHNDLCQHCILKTSFSHCWDHDETKSHMVVPLRQNVPCPSFLGCNIFISIVKYRKILKNHTVAVLSSTSIVIKVFLNRDSSKLILSSVFSKNSAPNKNFSWKFKLKVSKAIKKSV